MQFVKTENLKVGMISVKGLFDDKGTKLLAANKMLTEPIIRALKINHYAGIYTYDEFSKYEDLESLIPEETRINAIGALKTLSIDKVIYLANEIVESILKQKDVLIEMKDLEYFHGTTYEHSVNVASLSVPCGIGLGLNNKQLEHLATAAMLHDIGKMSIPKNILDKPGKLNEYEWELMKRHPEYGYNMLYDNFTIHPDVRTGILLHHENVDGTGYPKGYTTERIPMIAKIIHVADVYDALCRKRAYKDEYKASEAIEYLMGNCGTMFDRDVVSAFLRYITVYPVGTDVLLSDGRIARIVKNRAENILRPVVMIKDTMKKIDLLKDKNTYNLVIKQEL